MAKHLQALLSSTLTARGLIAPVRFIWEAAEGASCSFTAPRLGFSSTRCLAFGQMNGDRDSYPYAETSVWIHSSHCPLPAPESQRKATLRGPSFGGRTRLRRTSPRKDTGMSCCSPPMGAEGSDSGRQEDARSSGKHPVMATGLCKSGTSKANLEGPSQISAPHAARAKSP